MLFVSNASHSIQSLSLTETDHPLSKPCLLIELAAHFPFHLQNFLKGWLQILGPVIPTNQNQPFFGHVAYLRTVEHKLPRNRVADVSWRWLIIVDILDPIRQAGEN